MSQAGSHLFDQDAITRRRLRRFLGLSAAVLVALRLGAEVAPALRRPDLQLLDFWQSLRGVEKASGQVVIVAIDEKSIARFGPPAWPRSEYVPLVERLAGAGAAVIGFDMTFGALEREEANSRLLAEAMKRAGNVVFGYEFTGVGDATPEAAPLSQELRANALSRFESIAVPPASGVIEPEPVLARAAAALGHVRTVESEDGRVRVLPLFMRHADKVYPSLGLQMARMYTKTPAPEVELARDVVSMGAFRIPVSGSGEVLLNWPAAGDKAFPQYSFLDVVRGDVPDEAFRGKAVLVAGTADGLDDRDFPFAVEAPGVLIYATFLDNVLRMDFVRAPVWAWLLEWALFFGLCGLGVWLLPRLPSPALLVGAPALALFLLATAAFLFVQKGAWLSVFYPCLALLVPMGVTVILRLTASEKETRDAAADKVESQKLLGLSFQEKGMLDMALATFNALPFTKDMHLVYLNLGLDYEHRSQRDKALLVYKRVHEVDPSFEDVGRRIERLSQGMGSLISASPASAPTFVPAATAAPAPSADPLAHLVPTQGFAGQAPTEIKATADEAGAADPLSAWTAMPTMAGSGSLPTQRPLATNAGVGEAPSGPVGPGARFGRYEVERHIGRGGMGDVYLVHDTVIQRRAALKTIRPDTNLTPAQAIEVRQRFYREAQTAGKLAHPNIVTIYDVGEDLGVSYIVMEFIEGQSLADWATKQRLSIPQVKHAIGSAALGLDYAHAAGVFHRDVKPDNIMLTSGGVVKVMDFGIARLMESSLTNTGIVIGTPAYMSPEQVNGERVDARSDIFSLGVILYELLTGQKPFKGETMPALMFAIIMSQPQKPSEVDPNLHPDWDAIVMKALAKDREERYAHARELADAVRAAGD